MPALPLDFDPTPSPLDAFEQVLTTYQFDYVRTDDDDLILSVLGQCGSYQLHLSWQHEFDALQIVCSFPSTTPRPDSSTLARLLMTSNAQIWMGHFECSSDDQIQFRYTTLLNPDLPMDGIDTMNDLFKLAVAECDRFYPALILLADDPQASDESVAFALQDTAGQG